jgi:hypothetical protein
MLILHVLACTGHLQGGHLQNNIFITNAIKCVHIWNFKYNVTIKTFLKCRLITAVVFLYRPKWDVNTTPEQLQAAERDEFLEWRRCLANLQEVEGVLLTPYEKNLEFWRQLWRVVERR